MGNKKKDKRKANNISTDSSFEDYSQKKEKIEEFEELEEGEVLDHSPDISVTKEMTTTTARQPAIMIKDLGAHYAKTLRF